MSVRAGPSAGARIGRLLATVLLFVVLGPLLGAVLWIGILAALSLPPPTDADPSFTWFTLLGLIYAVPMSYFVGTGPAAVAGLVLGLAQYLVGRAGWPLALGTGLVVGVVVLERSGDGALPSTPDQGPFPEFSAILILACLIATLLCWSLMRSWNFTPAGTRNIMPEKITP